MYEINGRNQTKIHDQKVLLENQIKKEIQGRKVKQIQDM